MTSFFIYFKYFFKIVDELEKIFTSDLTLNKYFQEIHEQIEDVKQFLKIRLTILLQNYQKLNFVSF
jgi:hypothetical protein